MDWSLGLEPWSGVLEWILGVEPWKEILEHKRNIYSGCKIGLVFMDAIAKHVTNALPV